nr:MAG TPA: hypothetical protein [Caudoviricetes sp.]
MVFQNEHFRICPIPRYLKNVTFNLVPFEKALYFTDFVPFPVFSFVSISKSGFSLAPVDTIPIKKSWF